MKVQDVQTLHELSFKKTKNKKRSEIATKTKDLLMDLVKRDSLSTINNNLSSGSPTAGEQEAITQKISPTKKKKLNVTKKKFESFD